MKNIDFKELNSFLWEHKEKIFEDLEKYGYTIQNLGSSGFRINPCPFCGHLDCCTVNEVDENISLGKCFSCDNKFNFKQLVYKCYETKET